MSHEALRTFLSVSLFLLFFVVIVCVCLGLCSCVQSVCSVCLGRDLRCVVVGNKLVASMMRIAKTGFKANVHQGMALSLCVSPSVAVSSLILCLNLCVGGAVKPIAVRKQLKDLVVRATQLCLLDICGVDLLLDRPGYKICEMNSSPGFEGLERATGVDCAKAMVTHARQCVLQRRREGGRKKVEDMIEIPVQEDHEIAGLNVNPLVAAPSMHSGLSLPVFAAGTPAAVQVQIHPIDGSDERRDREKAEQKEREAKEAEKAAKEKEREQKEKEREKDRDREKDGEQLVMPQPRVLHSYNEAEREKEPEKPVLPYVIGALPAPSVTPMSINTAYKS